eukprot:PITA_35588
MIATQEEKKGGRCRVNRDGSVLKDFIQDNWLIDLPIINGLFTWRNKRAEPQQIASRLGHFLISDNAVHIEGQFTATILPYSGSDHWPIAMHWNRPGNNTRRPFKFEAFWLNHPNFHDLVRSTWQNLNPMEDLKMARFRKKLKCLKEEIKRWNKSTFGNIFKEKELLNKEMKTIQQKITSEGRTVELSQKEQDTEQKILERDRQEEILWRQKSRVQWLQEGERNTKFFHKTTVQRHMSNQISYVMDEKGNRIETHEGIEKEFYNYFKTMNQEPNINRNEAIEKITSHIPRLINEDHNTLLLKPISLQEVEEAVNLLKARKAPGPDGFTANFFQHFWETIKWEVWQVAEESRVLRWMYQGMNATFIALIPKAEYSPSPDKYRPITLCNIIYKIVSKVIALRLKPLLSLIISLEQSGYVEGRQITDGIILTHEVIHSLKHKKKPGMLLKIDVSKAFDSISWEYMQSILHAFGFAPAWVRWVSSLISSAFFSILINGIPSSTFRPTRGIRQGDPLSPLLFVIMAEGLGRSIKSALLSSKIKGALMNRVKSQLFFFNTPPVTQRAIARILGFTIATFPSKYLGAPLIASALKHAAWTDLLDKLQARLFLWTHRALNMASRVILIKVVLQSIPLYLFSFMAAPKWVLKAIKQLQRNFLWGSSGPNRKWALIKWEKATLPKIVGGIGLREPKHSNIIMGAKM